MAGAGYRSFSAGAVLTAAQVNTFLMEQSVMNFAGTAARGSALASVLSAGQMAHVGGGTVTVYDGSAWQQVYPAQPGLVYVAGTAFSAAASVSVNNCFTSTYDNYRILFRATSSSSFNAELRMRVGGVDDTATNYQYTYIILAGSTSTVYRVTAQTSMMLTPVNTGHNAANCDIFSPAIATPTIYVSDAVRNGNTTTVEKVMTSGGHGLSTAYDGCTLICTSGTLTGTLRVYGYRNS